VPRAGPILILGPASRPYSYARIIRSLVSRLAHRYEFHQFAIDATAPTPGHEHVIHFNSVPGDVYGVEQLPALIAAVRPAILWVINDMWLYFAHMNRLRSCAKDVRVILYAPIDGVNLSPAFARALEGVSRLVLFTQFAKRVFETAVGRLAEAEGLPPSRLPDIALIPHGVDTDRFRPCEDIAEGGLGARRSARRALFPDRAGLEDAFIVLNANQNNMRKRLDLTIEGFARFAEGKPKNVLLYLHTNAWQRGAELVPIARACGITDRLLLTGSGRQAPDLTDGRLNLIYNACDVGLNTSLGEGWGMVAFEHGATRAAQVMPRHSACEELWVDAGVLLEAPEVVRHRHDAVEYRATTPERVAAALEALYASPSYRLERASAAYVNATDPKYSWNGIAAQWDALFEETVGRAR